MFKQIETTTFPDREPEIHITLVDKSDEPTDEKWSDEKRYTVRFERMTIDQVTLEELLATINQKIEDENYHLIDNFPNFLIGQLIDVVGKEVAKTILWNMVERAGFLLGL